MRSDHYLQLGALELAHDIQVRDHDLIERVDVRNGDVMISPVDNTIEPEDRERLESLVEEMTEGLPFTLSEWWTDIHWRGHFLVVSSYWPTGGQLSREQLAEYDEFMELMEACHG